MYGRVKEVGKERGKEEIVCVPICLRRTLEERVLTSRERRCLSHGHLGARQSCKVAIKL